MKEYIEKLISSTDLSREEAYEAMIRIMEGSAADSLIAAFLMSILGLIFSIISSVINLIIAPVVFMAEIAEKAAQKATTRTQGQRSNKSRDSQEASIYNSPFTRF